VKAQALSRLLQNPNVRSIGAPDPASSFRDTLKQAEGNEDSLLFAFEKNLNGVFVPDGEVVTNDRRYRFYISREQSNEIRNLSAYLLPASELP
jgi:hypothetical protein